jgi:hypothetical protein
MKELLSLCSEIKRDLQEIIRSLAKITKTHAQVLIDEWSRKDETLKILGISSRTFNRLTNTGQLPFSKVNGLIFVKTTDIEGLLNKNYKPYVNSP